MTALEEECTITVTAAWGAIRASLQSLGFHDIKGMVGLDVFALARVRQ